MYDYLIVGAGLFGSVFAHEAKKAGRKCLVIDKRDHIGGNCFTRTVEGINVHVYGPHIFHTNNESVWRYVGQFAEFNRYTNMPVANYMGEIYPLPFNMNTFNRLWGVTTPSEAAQIIESQSEMDSVYPPTNLEDFAIRTVGYDVYQKLIKGYTEKQWGRPCKSLPPSILKRIPVRFTYDNDYFQSRYQGIPIGGYTSIFEGLLEGIDVRLQTNYLDDIERWNRCARRIVYTGCIDEFFDFRYGTLDYRSVRFETRVIDASNYQGCAVVNFTDAETPWTRIIEHKHFEFGTQPKTVITLEYSSEYDGKNDAFYPVNDQKNNDRYKMYQALSKSVSNTVFGGRLGMYRYMDMDSTVSEALKLSEVELK